MSHAELEVPNGDPDVENAVTEFTREQYRKTLTAKLEQLYEQQKAALEQTEATLRMVRIYG